MFRIPAAQIADAPASQQRRPGESGRSTVILDFLCQRDVRFGDGATHVEISRLTRKILSASMPHFGDNAVPMRVRLTIIAGCAVCLGYFLGHSPAAEWISDLLGFATVSLTSGRSSRSGGGLLPVLAAGFLLGQALYFAVRRILAGVEPLRAKEAERLASWDCSLGVGTRFGLQQYLAHCVRWASGDSARRTQTLGLLKIHGLDRLNETRGTLVTGTLLRRVASEIRVAALPEDSSGLRRWLTQYFPHAQISKAASPPRRYAARWSGATFALAFREQEPVEALGLLRELASWVREELDELGLQETLSVSAIAVVGGAGTSTRGFFVTAGLALGHRNTAKLRVLLNPEEPRAALISEMEGVVVEVTTIESSHCPDGPNAEDSSPKRLAAFSRSWGPVAACLVGAAILLAVPGNTRSPAPHPTWPDTLTDLQVMDANGPRTIRLIRSKLVPQSSATWSVSAARIVQGDPADGSFSPLQFHVSVTNRSSRKYYVSPLDFEAIDSNGRTLAVDVAKTLRAVNGFVGRWLGPGESCSGWIISSRMEALAEVVRFQPDRLTRLDLSVRSGSPCE